MRSDGCPTPLIAAADRGLGSLAEWAAGDRSRSDAAALGADDRGDPRREVAEVVGEVGVVAADQTRRG